MTAAARPSRAPRKGASRAATVLVVAIGSLSATALLLWGLAPQPLAPPVPLQAVAVEQATPWRSIRVDLTGTAAPPEDWTSTAHLLVGRDAGATVLASPALAGSRAVAGPGVIRVLLVADAAGTPATRAQVAALGRLLVGLRDEHGIAAEAVSLPPAPVR